MSGQPHAHTPAKPRKPAVFLAATLLQLFAPSVIFIAVFATLVAFWQSIAFVLGRPVTDTAVYTCLAITTLLAAWQGKTILIGINQAFRVHGISGDAYLRSFALHLRRTRPPENPAGKTADAPRSNIHLA
jgi:hypothetical protein